MRGDSYKGKGKHPGKTLAAVILAGMLGLTSAFAADSVTLNFKEADIEAIIGAVAETTGKNFIVDPRVKAKVTIISTRPMTKSEVYEVFLSVLQVHGFAAVPSGNVIKIIPDVNAKQTGVPVDDITSSSYSDQVVTAVMPLENVSAAQLVPILRPMIPQQGHMVAYQPTNVLIVSDRVSSIARLKEIIGRIDQPGIEEDIEVIPLSHASAAEVARILTTLDQQAKQAEAKVGGAPSESPLLVADDRTNSILVGGGKAGRMKLRAIISHLDTPLETGGSINVVYLRYASAKDLVPVLTGVGQTFSQDQAKKAQPGTAPGAAPPFNIQADESTNALVITAPPDMFRSLQTVIRQLDVRRAQVYVEAVIAELSMNRAAELGIQWAVDGTPGGKGPVGLSNFSSSSSSLADMGLAAATNNLSNVKIGDGLTLGLGKFNSSTLNFAALLRALQGDGTTNVLSTPTLVTLDNKEAEIVVGQNVPFVTGSFTSTGGTSTPTNPFQTIKRENVGVTLKVKPQINEGNTIKLDVEQKVESLAASSLGAVDVVTNTRTINTSVLVDDGEVVVLGGLITDDLKESIQKIPILGDIPLLGALFTHKRTTKDKTNLMVFLHPVIMRDQVLMSEVTNSKYNFMRTKQLELQERGVALIRDKESPLMPSIEDYRKSLPISAPAPRQEPQGAVPAAPAKPAQEQPAAGTSEAVTPSNEQTPIETAPPVVPPPSQPAP